MSFNLRAVRKRQPMERIRGLAEDCVNLRPSDLDGMPDAEINRLVDSIPQTKVAVHGTGQTWTALPGDYDPYRTSPLVNNPGPEFGGRWRRNMPGGGDQHINDNGDKDKDTKGSGDDNNPALQKTRINDLLEEIKGPTYIVRMRLSEEVEPSSDRAKEMFGPDGKTDGESIYVEVNGYERAIKLRDKYRDATIEPKGVQ